MSFSLTEDTIHLTCAPNPDMAGVFLGGGKGGSLGARAREWMGREEEGVGERMDLYPLIKAVNIKRLPTQSIIARF